jgi:Flp pilus assembly protein TadB
MAFGIDYSDGASAWEVFYGAVLNPAAGTAALIEEGVETAGEISSQEKERKRKEAIKDAKQKQELAKEAKKEAELKKETAQAQRELAEEEGAASEAQAGAVSAQAEAQKAQLVATATNYAPYVIGGLALAGLAWWYFKGRK